MESTPDPIQRPRVGIIVIDVYRYTIRWVRSLLDAADAGVILVGCIPPLRAIGAHPGGARGLLPAGPASRCTG